MTGRDPPERPRPLMAGATTSPLVPQPPADRTPCTSLRSPQPGRVRRFHARYEVDHAPAPHSPTRIPTRVWTASPSRACQAQGPAHDAQAADAGLAQAFAHPSRRVRQGAFSHTSLVCARHHRPRGRCTDPLATRCHEHVCHIGARSGPRPRHRRPHLFHPETRSPNGGHVGRLRLHLHKQASPPPPPTIEPGRGPQIQRTHPPARRDSEHHHHNRARQRGGTSVQRRVLHVVST